MAVAEKAGRIACRIYHNREIASRIFEMVLAYPASFSLPAPGQFVNLYCRHQGRLLPRPVSVCEVIEGASPLLRLVYAIQGAGTLEFSRYRAGESVEILGPFGNGFSLPGKGRLSGTVPRKVLLIGGGVGTPPMVELAKQLAGSGAQPDIVVGFRDETYLLADLGRYGRLHVATESGTRGFRGNVVDLIIARKLSAERIYACGPASMLRGVQQLAVSRRVAAEFSLEERMGCGFGGCVGCAVKIVAHNEAGFVYKKVCRDGPVFAGEEVLP